MSSATKTIVQRRLKAVERFKKIKRKIGSRRAAQIVGSSLPTLWRWQKRLAAHGPAGLRPKNFNAGRRSPFATVKFSAKALRSLELLIVEQPSPRLAWQQFAQSSPDCPPAVANYLQRYGRPPALLAGMGRARPVQALVLASADQRRLYVKLLGKGTLRTKLSVPDGLSLVKLSAEAKG